MRWLRVGIGIAVAAAVAAALPAGATAFHDAPAAAQPPGYFLSADDSVDNPPGGQGQASVSCAPGVVWGGGVSNHVDSPTGVSISITSPTGTLGWIGRENNPTGQDTALDVTGICADKPAGYKIVKEAVNAPVGTQRTATATCPAPTVLLSGGADSATSSPLSQITSAAPTSSTTFTGYISNGSSAAVKLQVFAICAKQPRGWVMETKTFPATPGQSRTPLDCPANTAVLGGGVALAKHTPSVYIVTTSPLGSAGWVSGVTNETTHNVKSTMYAICGR